MKRLTFVCLAFVFWLSGDFFTPGQPETVIAAKENWFSVKSTHFTLIGDASENDIRKVALKLEQFRAAVSYLFDKPTRKFTPPITVVVFKDDAAYTPFKPLYQGNPSALSGYFQSSSDAIYITLAANWRGSNPYAVILHEYVHYLTSNGSLPLPVWLAEGLADYYSAFETEAGGRKIFIGRAIPERVQLLRTGSFLPLKTLLTVNHDSPFYNEADKKNVFYAESWALVHYLLAGGNMQRQSQFQQFLSLLAERLPAELAFKQAFQNDQAGLESELIQYIRRNRYASRQLGVDGKIEIDLAMQTAPLGEAEALARLGDLLWHISRYEEGAAMLQRALAIDPHSLAAHTSLGILRIRQKLFIEARGHLRQTVDANSNDYLAHYYYAYAWQQEQVDNVGYVSYFTPEAVTQMRASLNRARQLAPEFADTYKSLAFIALVQADYLPFPQAGQQAEHQAQKPPETLADALNDAEALIKHALELEPEREDFVYTLAQVYSRQQNFIAARQVAGRLIQTTARPDISDRARFLLESISKREADLARTKAEEEARQRERASQAGEDDATRPPGKRFEGEQVRGLLTRIECLDSTIVLTVVSGLRAFKFRAEQGKLAFVRHTMDIPNQITCGAIVPARQVIVTYRPSSNARLKIDGEPVGVEFLKLGTD